MKVKKISAIILSLVFGTASIGNVFAADSEGSSVSLSSLKSNVNRIQTYVPGEAVQNEYLKIKPLSEISYGDTIILNFENATVLDEQEDFGDLLGEGFTYEEGEDLLDRGATARGILDLLWADNLDDAFIPWRLTKLSDTSVQAELFPVPEDYCNVGGVSSYSSAPYYYLPLTVEVTAVGKASVSIEAGGELSESMDFAYVVENEGDDSSCYITEEPDSSYTYINYRSASENYLYITPWSEVCKGEYITLTFENAYVPDELPLFEDYGGGGMSYDSVCGYLSSGYTVKNALDELWKYTSDVYIPWKMTKLSDTSIKVELYPIPLNLSNTYYNISGTGGVPYYFLPLAAEYSEGSDVKLTINHNGLPVSGGVLGDIFGDVDCELTFISSTGTITGYRGKPTDVVIPSEIDGVSVESIENRAFVGCEFLESLTFEGSSVSIDSYAFSGCTNLKVIDFSNGSGSIDFYAFINCASLEKVYCTPGSKADVLGYYSSSEKVNLVYTDAKTVKNHDGTLYYVSGFNLEDGDSLGNYSHCELYYNNSETGSAESIDTSDTVYTGFEIDGIQFDANEMGYDYIVGYKISSESTVTNNDINGFESNYSLKLVEKTEEA